MEIDLSGMFTALIAFGMLIVATIWGLYELTVWIWFSETIIEVSQPLEPEIKLIVKDNVVDTLYIYREPNK